MIDIIQKYYDKDSKLYEILTVHSWIIAQKSVEIARILNDPNIDLNFVYEASMLHDIWIYLTDAKKIECFGEYRYICHGYLGREILEKEWLPKHWLVCERHTYITLDDIKKQWLPIPQRDMTPQTIEEEIICYVDKFYSKDTNNLTKAKTIEEIKRWLSKFGNDKVIAFENMVKKFWEIV